MNLFFKEKSKIVKKANFFGHLPFPPVLSMQWWDWDDTIYCRHSAWLGRDKQDMYAIFGCDSSPNISPVVCLSACMCKSDKMRESSNLRKGCQPSDNHIKRSNRDTDLFHIHLRSNLILFSLFQRLIVKPEAKQVLKGNFKQRFFGLGHATQLAKWNIIFCLYITNIYLFNPLLKINSDFHNIFYHQFRKKYPWY